MGYRYRSDICIPDENAAAEPRWLPSKYTPTTWPGSRAPHVFLNNGSAIFDHYGQHYTLIEFVDFDTDGSVDFLLTAAKRNSVLLKHVRLIGEGNARRLWEKNLVLLRPDGHVSWRSDRISNQAKATEIIRAVAGIREPLAHGNGASIVKHEKANNFTVVEMETQDSEYRLEKMGVFQG
jgi:FAD-dependent monooxygenase